MVNHSSHNTTLTKMALRTTKIDPLVMQKMTYSFRMLILIRIIKAALSRTEVSKEQQLQVRCLIEKWVGLINKKVPQI